MCTGTPHTFTWFVCSYSRISNGSLQRGLVSALHTVFFLLANDDLMIKLVVSPKFICREPDSFLHPTLTIFQPFYYFVNYKKEFIIPRADIYTVKIWKPKLLHIRNRENKYCSYIRVLLHAQLINRAFWYKSKRGGGAGRMSIRLQT